MDYEGRVNLNWNGFVAAIGGYEGKESKDYQNATPVTFHSAHREDALLAFKNSTFTIGAEYFAETNWYQVGSTTADKGDGFSSFGSFNFMPQWSVFGRYDNQTPSKTLHPSEKLSYFNIGLNYEPVKVLDLALVFKHDEVKNAAAGGWANEPNTTLAPLSTGVAGNPYANGHYNEVGVFGQFKF